MTLISSKLGNISYTSADILHFPQGLLGFETIKHYLLIHKQENPRYYFLQAIDDGELCFILIYPNHFFTDYKITCSQAQSFTHHFVIVSQREQEQPTVNLLGPIIIDKTRQKGWQLISENSQYPTRYPLPRHPKITTHVAKDQVPIFSQSS